MYSIFIYMPYPGRCHCCSHFFQQEQSWTRMISYMSKTMLTTSYGKWDVDVWELLLGKFMGKIPSCPFAFALIQQWKQIRSHVKWDPSNPNANSLHIESLYWSVVFYSLLACQEPIKAYNLSKMGIRLSHNEGQCLKGEG